MNWRKVIFTSNVIVIFIFLCFMALTFLWPEYIPFLYLSTETCMLIIMHLISLLFLLAFFQTHLSLPWRIFSIISSFLVLIESTMMLQIWR